MWREALTVHPSPERLDAYADRRLEGDARRRVTCHLARCGRCRRAVNATRRLATQAAAIPARGFDAEAILAGAVSRRAAGERVALPAGSVRLPDEGGSPQRLVRAGVAIAIAASLVLLASGAPVLRRFMGGAERSTTLTSGDACASAARHEEEGMSFRRVLKAVLLGPALAAAGGCAEDRSIGAPVVTTFDGTRMKPAELVYEWRTVVGETQTGDVRPYSVRVERARLGGIDTWVQRMQVGGTHVTPSRTLDSLYYEARTMTPVRSVSTDKKQGRWVWERRDGLVRLVEAPAWVAALDTTNRGRRNFRRQIERQMSEPRPTLRSVGATVGPAPLELLTPGLPLASDWRGTLNVHPEPLNLGYGMSGGGMLSAHSLAVTGTRTVTTPAGTFDAWVLRGSAPATRDGDAPVALEAWVDRRDGWMLRLQATQLDKDGDPWISETTLQRVTLLR
jgi:hypothetical protein